MKLDLRDLNLWTKILSLLLIAVAVVRGPLGESFWLDETLTLWANKVSVAEMISRVTEAQGQSPLYFLLVRPLIKLTESEYILKASSTITTLLYLWIFFLLLRRRFSFEVSLFGTALLFSTDLTIISAFSIRPYALAMLTSLGATYSLLNWLERQRQVKYLTTWFVLMVATFYLHYLFALLAIPHLILILNHRSDLTKKDWAFLGICIALGILASIPGLNQILSLSSRVSSLSFAPMPTLIEFFKAILPPSILVFSTTAFLVAGFFSRFDFNYKWPGCNAKLLSPLIVGWLLTPIFFGIHAHLTGHSMFIDRWFMWTTPAFIYLLCALIKGVQNQRAVQIFVLVGIGLMITREADRRWQVEDWRLASQEVARQESQKVVLYSGLIELENSQLIGDKTKAEYLAAPLFHYGVKNRIIPVGLSPLSNNLQEYYLKNLYPEISSEESFVFVGLKRKILTDSQAIKMEDSWILAFSELGFAKAEKIINSPLNQVLVIKFSR